jgi:hypothetical protein
MKKVVLLIAIAFTGLTANAQFSNYKYDGRKKSGNFQLKPASIVWTKVYDTIPGIEKKFIPGGGILSDSIPEYDGEVVIRPTSLNIAITFRFSILQFKGFPDLNKNLYKVNVTEVRVFSKPYSDPFSEVDPIESILLTKRGRFKRNIFEQYDILFSDFFDPKKKLD